MVKNIIRKILGAILGLSISALLTYSLINTLPYSGIPLLGIPIGAYNGAFVGGFVSKNIKVGFLSGVLAGAIAVYIISLGISLRLVELGIFILLGLVAGVIGVISAKKTIVLEDKSV